MAGKRHHFIPQFLLRGFACNITGKNAYCWLYKANQKPLRTNTKNIGLERSFYSFDGNNDVDETITREEGEYASIVNRYRSIHSDETDLPSDIIADLLTHLTLRTRHVRESFKYIADSFLRELVSFFDDPRDLERMILRYVNENPTFIRNSLMEEAVKRGIDVRTNSHLINTLEEFTKTNVEALVKNGAAQHHNDIVRAFRGLRDAMPGRARTSHIGALSKGTSPEPRRKLLADLHWKLRTFNNHSFILGDVVCWGILKSSSTPVSLLWSGDGIKSVYLPISHRHLIVGSIDRHQDTADPESINSASARLSQEFFVSSIQSEERLPGHTMIGAFSNDFVDTQLQETMHELRRDIL